LSPPQEGKRRQGLGDVRIVTSPDGSRLYCCSECLMAYTDKTVLEHHLAANHKVTGWNNKVFNCDLTNSTLILGRT